MLKCTPGYASPTYVVSLDLLCTTDSSTVIQLTDYRDGHHGHDPVRRAGAQILK